jgi:hypothetical protein
VSESKKQAILTIILLSTVLTAALLARTLAPARGSHPSTTQAPIDYMELSHPPRATVWYIPDYPAIEAMRENIVHTFQLCETGFEGVEGPVYGLVPAREYGSIFVRDTSTMTPALRYFYGEEYLRTPVEEFLRRQYGPDTESIDGDTPGDGAISAVIALDGHIDKATVVSDEETHLIHAAYAYYRTIGGADWLGKELTGEAIIVRLNRALDWLYTHRFDSAHQLIKRGHSTDWGDIKFEPSLNPTDLDPVTDHWTCSIYDQALAYRALLELAEMNQALGDNRRAHGLRERAERLRLSTNANLWSLQGGFYFIHLHLLPLAHPFAEEEMISIANALTAYVGLADPARTKEILANLERARLAARAGKPGVSLYPPYPAGFFTHVQMSPGEYQNGGLWDWWGGLQITAEFENGYSSLALAHLRMVAQDWARHPQQIFEWQMPQTNEGWGAENYASAAGTMGEAIVRGLFGVTIEREGVRLQPRLREHEGQIRVLQPASGFYVSYDYRHGPSFIVLDYGSNHLRSLEIKVLLPLGKEIQNVSIDGLPVSHHMEIVAEDSYCAFQAPSGVHRIVVNFNGRQGSVVHRIASDSNWHIPLS